jgi:hypothetical protein
VEERLSAPSRRPVAGRLVDIKGSAGAVDITGTPRRLVPGSFVRAFDEVRTTRGSYAVLVLRDQGHLVLHPDTRVVFQRFQYDPGRPADAEVNLMLYSGRIGTKTGLIGKARPTGYRVSTRLGHLETRGTTAEASCTGSCAGYAIESWAPISAEVMQAVVAYAQQMGLPPSEVQDLQRYGGASYASLQQYLQGTLEIKGEHYAVREAGSQAWWPLLEALASAGSGEAAAAALTAPLPVQPVSAWGAQTSAGQFAEQLKAYAQQAGLPEAAQTLLPPGDVTLAQLYQLMQDDPVLWGPLLALFDSVGNIYALNTALNAGPPSGSTMTASDRPSTSSTTAPASDGMEVTVTEGAVDVTTSSGTVTVNEGQSASVSGSGGGLLMIPASLRQAADAPNIQLPGIDSMNMFQGEPAVQPGLYVWVREGAVQFERDGRTFAIGAGSAALATTDSLVQLDAVPNFMRFDPTPRPAPAGGQRVSDVFVAPDGSQSLMCKVR